MKKGSYIELQPAKFLRVNVSGHRLVSFTVGWEDDEITIPVLNYQHLWDIVIKRAEPEKQGIIRGILKRLGL